MAAHRRQVKIYYYTVEDAQGGLHEYDVLADNKHDGKEMAAEMARNDEYDVLSVYFQFCEPKFTIQPRLPVTG